MKRRAETQKTSVHEDQRVFKGQYERTKYRDRPGTCTKVKNRREQFVWNLYARFYDSIYHLIPYRKLLWDTYQALDFKPGMKILDAGCGTGNFEKFISEKNPPPIQIEATDFSPVMLARAQKKCKHLGYVNFKLADLNKELDYPAGTFDRILSINVLYALEDCCFTIQGFLRILKPEGKIVLTSSKPDFRFSPIIQDHFKRIKNIWGISRRVATLLKTFVVVSTTGLGSGLLNIYVINRRERRGIYRSLSKEEFASIFERDSQNIVQNLTIDSSFADQNLVAIATKVTSGMVQK